MKRIGICLLILLTTIQASEPLSLTECRQRALDHNHKAKIAAKETAIATQYRKTAFTNFLPRVDFVGSYLRTNKNFYYNYDLSGMTDLLTGVGNYYYAVSGGASLLADDPFYATLAQMAQSGNLPSEVEFEFGQKNNYVMALNLTQPLFTGGKIYNLYQMSRNMEEIAKANEDLTEAEVLQKTDEYYWQLVSLQAKVKLAEKYLANIDAHLTDLENYLAEGLITNNTLLTVQVKRDEADLMLFKAKNGVKLVQMALCQYIGMPFDSDITATTDLESQIIVRKNLEPETVSRPEIKILEKAVDMAQNQVKIQQSRYLPNVVLTTDYITLNPNPYNSFKKEYGSDFMIGITAQMEIFNWNERGHQLKSARYQHNIAELKLDETREMIQLDVQQSLFQVNEAVKKVEMTTTSLAQAEENLRITEDNFHEGLSSSTDFLDAQTLWQKAHSANIDSKTEYQVSLTKLQKALGTLTENEKGTKQ